MQLPSSPPSHSKMRGRRGGGRGGGSLPFPPFSQHACYVLGTTVAGKRGKGSFSLAATSKEGKGEML